jgi:hypothetical protein
MERIRPSPSHDSLLNWTLRGGARGHPGAAHTTVRRGPTLAIDPPIPEGTVQ